MLESLKVLGEAPPNEKTPDTQRKRLHGAESFTVTESHTGPNSESQAEPSVQATTSNLPADMDWEAPSIFGQAPIIEPETMVTSQPQHGQYLQSTGTVFGNVDFGALFGLGDGNLEGVRPWSPSSFDAALSRPSSGPLSRGGQGLGFETDVWSGMTFDFG